MTYTEPIANLDQQVVHSAGEAHLGVLPMQLY